MATESEIGRLCQGGLRSADNAMDAHHGYTQNPSAYAPKSRTPTYLCGLHDALQLAGLMCFLVSRGILPFETRRIASIHAICSILSNAVEKNTWSHFPLSACTMGCRACKTSFKDILNGIADEVSDSMVGLCIHCVRMGEDQSGGSHDCPMR